VPQELPGEVVGVAGTATTLGWLELGLERWDREAVHGTIVRGGALRRWANAINPIPTAERISRYGLGSGRADVFPAGLSVIEELLNHLGRGSLVISVNGLRVGVALSLLEEQPWT
jgi:exopolyphosphatase/guanosine-5'-triphosphate,3'-diphosphate pyrophosphatase